MRLPAGTPAATATGRVPRCGSTRRRRLAPLSSVRRCVWRMQTGLPVRPSPGRSRVRTSGSGPTATGRRSSRSVDPRGIRTSDIGARRRVRSTSCGSSSSFRGCGYKKGGNTRVLPPIFLCWCSLVLQHVVLCPIVVSPFVRHDRKPSPHPREHAVIVHIESVLYIVCISRE